MNCNIVIEDSEYKLSNIIFYKLLEYIIYGNK